MGKGLATALLRGLTDLGSLFAFYPVEESQTSDKREEPKERAHKRGGALNEAVSDTRETKPGSKDQQKLHPAALRPP
jgi:hypothetical protein